MPAAGAAIDAAICAGFPPAARACMTADAVGAILPTTGFAAAAICIAPDCSAPASGDDPADSANPAIPGNSFMGPLAFFSDCRDAGDAALLHVDVRNINFRMHLRRNAIRGFQAINAIAFASRQTFEKIGIFSHAYVFFLAGIGCLSRQAAPS
ncbi:hypothetical protein LGM89_03875 [Burkholderia sp. AU31624]|uniref:hypothetical protein n=1 Tax=Burkholderia TaxID=32008 RepID=UPI0015843E1B|nr:MULTISPECIES: hypothetical protein [Burkholderia]MCA8060984.1 hypothetical protein [Burkholderia sp. AU38729]MCA8252396.1 hypothetical protein [Burkholderia sp. AU31624]MDN7489363.1 hypothetical protein [Burkholderia sp. AU45274]